MNNITSSQKTTWNYYETAIVIASQFINEIKHYYNFKIIPSKWEKGLIHKIQYLLQQGIESQDIENCLSHQTPFVIINRKMTKPSELLSNISLEKYRRILIDGQGQERDKDIWGYFTTEGEYIKPINSILFDTLKEEEEKRVLSHQNNSKMDKFFQENGFLKPEYSFITGIFTEHNSKWVKI